MLIFIVKNLTDFRKTVEISVDPRLDTLSQARDKRERNCSGDTLLKPVWWTERERERQTERERERERVRLTTLN